MYSSFLKVGFVNLNSLFNKVPFVDLLLKQYNIDVLGVGETWLVQSIADSYVDINNYRLVRRDSPSNVRKHGIAIYIRQCIKFIEVPCNIDNTVIIKLTEQDVYILFVYRPPSNNAATDDLLATFIRGFCPDKEVILMGDFNLPSLRWENDNPAESYISRTDSKFLDVFTDLGLTQTVTEPTNFPSSNILDLCLLSHRERLGSASIKPPLPACSHGVVLLEYTFQELPPSHNFQNKKVWTKGNYALISDRLANYDWTVEFEGLNTQQMYSRLLNILGELIEQFVPTSKRSMGKPPWTLNPPRNLTDNKSRTFSLFKDTRRRMGRSHEATLAAWQDFISANNAVKNFSKQSQESYEVSIVNQITTNPKLFHSYLRHRRVGRPSIGPLKCSDGSVTDNPAEMAAQFVSSFVGVFANQAPAAPAAHQTSNEHLPDILISPSDVLREIKSLNTNSSMGMDGIHPRLLSRCASTLSMPLSIIYNASLRAGALPLEWLSSQVTPIFKKGARTDPLNYRPVSITSVPCKVMEKVILSHLKPFLEENELISEHQFGFRSGRSTTDQLVLCYNDITQEVDNGKTLDLIFFDYSKAFDKVCHTILLQKLTDIGVSTQLVRWISDFITSRRMQTRVHGATSDWHRVTSGVPQGSVLGPVLFLIYVNHVVNRLSCRYKIFADDIKLYLSWASDAPSAGTDHLQEDIDLLVRTSASWGLIMNAKKCVCLRFGPRTLRDCSTGNSPYKIGNVCIKYSRTHSDLGITIDRNLKLHDHIRTTANKCNGITTNILSSTVCREPNFLLAIYKTYIRHKLEYGSQVWSLGYLGDLRSLERVQRRWTRAMRGLEVLPYPERLRILGLFSVQGRLLRADLIQTWKILSGKSAISPAQLFQLDMSSRRGHSKKIFLPRANLEIRRRFFSIRVILPWNSLSEEAVSAPSLTIFKRFLHRDLGQRLYDYTD